ncbi:glycosyltransferase [Kocuria soli]|uniref:D-inositol 3-phosphate glycosyltransferase n=1 Tax=Kocuria soli TaxID=2485125 RepID=A0A3N3ZR90_9MICC|nr:glycosyltransferase [Kocuria soli]ROZ63766.1 glycosyltransferase [Kocuria soli]
MAPPMYDDARRRLWHLRRTTAQWLTPSGLEVQATSAPDADASLAAETLAERVAAELEADREREAERAASVRAQALGRSAEARDGGNSAEAVDHLRRLLLDQPHDSTAWQLYALRLMESRNYGAAFEALKNALAEDPANLDALELLVDAGTGDKERMPAVLEAYDALVAALEQRPDQHRRSLDFVIPSSLDAALPILAESPDRITRAVVEQALEPEAAWDYPKPAWLSEDEYVLAKLLFSLQRGRRTRAIELMHQLPDRAVSRWSLRLAIRRDLRDNRLPGARRLLAEYRRLEPEDGWARQHDERLRKNSTPSNYQLAKQGFPFPHRRDRSAYDAVGDRIFYLLHNSLPYHSAGYSTRTHGLLTGLRDQGWDVRGVTRLGYPYDMPGMAELGPIPETDVVDGVPYHRLSITAGIEKKSPITSYVERYSRALERTARSERPAILHAASNHWNGLAAVATANRLGIPSIYEVRGLWEVTRGSRDPEWAQGGMYKFMARMEADAAAEATHVLAITQALKDELISRGVDGDKITVVPNAVNGDRFQPQDRDSGLEAELGLQGKTVIGYVGSVLDYEGLGLLIDAAEILGRNRDDFAVLIVGDGAELEKFQGIVQERGLEGLVRFTGRVPHQDVERYYSLVDIAPFPRLPLPVCEMVSPLKPFEALAMQKAVVASDVAALAEIITPGVNGLLHRKGDTDDLVRVLEQLLNDPQQRQDLAERGRTWVVENRQWSGVAGIVSDIYDQLGGRRASTPAG